MIIVLGIETSCDETGVAIYHADQGLLGHRLYSQIKTHAEYGGVVPELAAREHLRNLLPVTSAALLEAKVAAKYGKLIATLRKKKDLTQSEVAKAVKDPAVMRRFEEQGLEGWSSTPQEFAKLIDDEMELNRKLTAAMGIVPQ